MVDGQSWTQSSSFSASKDILRLNIFLYDFYHYYCSEEKPGAQNIPCKTFFLTFFLVGILNGNEY